MASLQRAAVPSGRGGGPRLVLGVGAVVVLVLGALVAVQVLVGGVPLLDAVVPRSGPQVQVVTGAPPQLDCGDADADGVVVKGAAPAGDLGAAAYSERDASPLRDTLVAATGYQRGRGGVDVVWVDGAGRARLVLTYAVSGAGWVLTGRSGCVT